MSCSKANFIYDTASIPSLEWCFDPILPLFALALMDNVFQDTRINAESVYNRSEAALPRGESVDLTIRQKAEELTVFRKVAFENGTWARSADAMKYMDVLWLFKKACFLAGFLGELETCTIDRQTLTHGLRGSDDMGLYAIRRLDAALLREPGQREADVRAAFGHNPNSHLYDVRV